MREGNLRALTYRLDVILPLRIKKLILKWRWLPSVQNTLWCSASPIKRVSLGVENRCHYAFDESSAITRSVIA